MSDQEKNELNISGSGNAYNEQCPTRLMLNRIADKWAILLLGLLEHEAKRFSTLQRETGGISQKMLTQTLRNLERDGLIQRTVYASVPPKVEYQITHLGSTLVAPLAAIRIWSEKHIEEVLAAQYAYDNAQDSEQQTPNLRKIVFK